MKERRIRIEEKCIGLKKEIIYSLDQHSSFDEVQKANLLFEQLIGDFYFCRTHYGNRDRLTLKLQSILSEVAPLFSSRDEENEQDSEKTWLEKYRDLWYDQFPLFVITAVIFIFSYLIGFNISQSYPEYIGVLTPDHMAENVHDGYQWFKELQKAPLLGSLQIAFNNLMVCLYGFILCGIFGIGGLYILIFNGVLIGAMFSYCYENGLYLELSEFVSAHGPLELSLIVASCFVGFTYGRTFYYRPFSRIGMRLKKAFEPALIAIGVICFWIVISGFVEGFVSPFDRLSLRDKKTIGFTFAAVFWGWTFFRPEKIVEVLRKSSSKH